MRHVFRFSRANNVFAHLKPVVYCLCVALLAQVLVCRETERGLGCAAVESKLAAQGDVHRSLEATENHRRHQEAGVRWVEAR